MTYAEWRTHIRQLKAELEQLDPDEGSGPPASMREVGDPPWRLQKSPEKIKAISDKEREIRNWRRKVWTDEVDEPLPGELARYDEEDRIAWEAAHPSLQW